MRKIIAVLFFIAILAPAYSQSNAAKDNQIEALKMQVTALQSENGMLVKYGNLMEQACKKYAEAAILSTYLLEMLEKGQIPSYNVRQFSFDAIDRILGFAEKAADFQEEANKLLPPKK